MGRVLLFNMHIASLVQFKAQLAEVDAATARAYTRACQRITRAPYMSLPPVVMDNLTAYNMPLEIRDLDTLATAAKAGVLWRRAVWGEVDRSIRIATASDDATLNPHRLWHATSVVCGAPRPGSRSKRRTSDALAQNRNRINLFS